MIFFRQRRPKKEKWPNGPRGPAQSFEKARFEEGNSFGFCFPGGGRGAYWTKNLLFPPSLF
jgi:hypothetical protein